MHTVKPKQFAMNKTLLVVSCVLFSFSCLVGHAEGGDGEEPSKKGVSLRQLSVDVKKQILQVCNPGGKSMVLRIYDRNGLLIESSAFSEPDYKVLLQEYHKGRYYYTVSNNMGTHLEGAFAVDNLLLATD